MALDPLAIEELYRKFGYAVYRRCLELTGTREAADDALQETFLRVMRYGEKFDGSHPLGWLYRISDRVCFDAIRKKRPAEVAPTAVLHPQESSAKATDQSIWFSQLLAHCDERTGGVAVCYFVDQMTQHEVAKQLNISRKTVKQHLAKFKILVRSIINRESGKGETDG